MMDLNNVEQRKVEISSAMGTTTFTLLGILFYKQIIYIEYEIKVPENFRFRFMTQESIAPRHHSSFTEGQ